MKITKMENFKAECLNCGFENTVTKETLFNDSLGFFTTCKDCESSFDVDEEKANELIINKN